ncbi:MAG: class Ib ribonucleoside-diphosphate reductase assembly flavoprotein NrdI [Actinomycetaceae bacterium]|nr:class Ib ribonucleoside-diphosphate reductase assembly flavoprotein NrdI [Actinomycetaceae bacterium]MDY6082801.1 class Ib ribonucleoside-diphosphate reductase assembly flavoprotein NrdI [Actinomycetaceae bacterium]
MVFFSSISENTWRFAVKLGFPAVRIPVYERRDPQPLVNEPYVILVPTYGGGNTHGAVPKQAIHFLNIKANRDLCVGVMSSGQKNFGKYYCIAADIIARKCGVRPLYRFELMGTPEDVRRAREGMEELWQSQILRHHSPEPKA